MKPAISIQNLTKVYSKKDFNFSSMPNIREILAGKFKKTTDEFFAVNDVSFDVYPSEKIALIGPNGAGKSTVLKILARITEPTSGKITLRGRVSSILGIGSGFHPDLTGKENMFLYGAMLGISRHNIKSRFEEIVSFAEIESFIDMPVKRYSNGMYLRLAFSIAAHLEPDVLILDEVLTVGDASFQHRCLERLQKITGDGCATIIVSHDLDSLKNFCQNGILLRDGRISFSGNISDTIDNYMSLVNK